MRHKPFGLTAHRSSCAHCLWRLIVAKSDSISFEAKVLRPAQRGKDDSWAFLVLPRQASALLPRRGRTSVVGTINGHPFQATLEPDGQLSHWLRVDKPLRKAAGIEFGDVIKLQVSRAKSEFEPTVPDDLRNAIAACPQATRMWESTTTIARIDWVHWVESAKQAATRRSRVDSARKMLASGKQRVCCFDQSGYYSKSFRSPEAEQ
ncbi:MAG: DUF1905 domain-containing protein [Dokdonella sp.]|uniref:YdeI/OmpD-associated family protein n=1 Tax=Dokdonella sp. TaxID=2291710 RepID=UPI0025B8AE22|nr:YdeI/OmpD-associated family protein [Dokdonella sp.]MBZ0222429.1 YdeI/OmpD-associated family protein [Dokdonella sp.]MCC7255817.1 DUF1905 domain-containing protein [Dokdonella sp.]